MPTNSPTKFLRDTISSKPSPDLPVDFMMDHDYFGRMMPGNENSVLAVRVSVSAIVSPSKIENANDLTRAVYSVLNGDNGNVTLYHYKLFESHAFFKDIKPFDATNDAYEFGNSVQENQDNGSGGSATNGLGEALAITAGVVGAICAVVVSFIKYKRHKESLGDYEEDSRNGDSISEALSDQEYDSNVFRVETVDTVDSGVDVESHTFEPFIFEDGPTSFQTLNLADAAVQEARANEHIGAIEVQLHR